MTSTNGRIFKMNRVKRAGFVLSCVAVATMNLVWAADQAPAPESGADARVELQHLKAAMAEQQKVIEQLKATLEAQQKMLERVSAMASAASLAAQHTPPPNVAVVASATPMAAPMPALAPRPDFAPPLPAAPTPQAMAEPASPLEIKIGETTIQPIGFMDMTADWKDKNAGGDRKSGGEGKSVDL